MAGTGKERGGALVFLAVCIAVVAGLIGLAVDLNLALSSSTEHQQLANAVASSALKAYLEGMQERDQSGNPLSEAALSARIMSRAEEIAGAPQNRMFYEGLLSDSSVEPALCLRTSERPACDLSFSTVSHVDSAAAVGSVFPGTWHYEKPDGSDPCANDYPCFNAAPLNGRYNAFQVELSQSIAAPLQLMFLRLLGFEHVRTAAVSTAAVIPRQIVILLDLSNSVVADTHPADVARAAYKLADGYDCSRALCNAGACPGIARSDDPNSMDYWLSEMYRQMPDIRNTDDPRAHFKQDYTCLRVQDDGPEDGSAPSYYLIDTYQNPARGHFGPEPLTSILRSINQALTIMEQSAQAGDGVALMGFDRTLLHNRRIPERGSPDLLAPIKTGDQRYELIKAITDVERQNDPYAGDLARSNLQVRVGDHVIFPRVNLFQTNRANSGIWTNLKYAAWTARQTLLDSSNSYADREVVAFSDFLANCSTSPWEDDPPHCEAPGLAANAGCCANDYSRIVAGGEVTYLVRDFFKKQKVHFNPVVFGSAVAPHTVVLYDGQGNCLWDEEIVRRQEWPYSYTNPSSGHCPPEAGQPPCYFPNKNFGAARDTGGVWGVIRPCCRVDGQCSDVTEDLNQYCRSTEAHRLTGYPVCRRTQDPSHCDLWEPAKDGQNQWNNPYVDDEGRILCDPWGREALAQMRDYMLDVMGTNPIRLVGPSRRITQ